MTSLVLRLVLLVMPAIVGAVQSGDDGDEYCRATRCKEDGPIIRFPFQLKGRQQQADECGYHHYPAFELSCSKSKETVIHLQYYAKSSQQGLTVMFYLDAFVTRIDYKAQQAILESRYPNLSRGFTAINSSAVSTPFRFSIDYEKLYVRCSDYNFFDDMGLSLYTCPSTLSDERSSITHMTTSKGDVSQVYILPSELLIFDLPLLTCTKLHTIFFPQGLYFLAHAQVSINWSIPDCGRCEAQGDYCRLADRNISINTSSTTTTCFPTPEPRVGSDKKAAAARQAGIIPSVVLVTLLLAALLHHLIRSHKRKKDDQLKIKMFLEDYKAMKPTRYSYSDIKKVTKHFSQKLGQGGFGSVYKGQISEEILVAVKVLNSDTKSDGEDFINEVGTIGQIHHVNVVRLVGYCADACNQALVYEFQPNQSLEKYVYSGKSPGSNFLGWEKMQEIALGIAKGIEYLHQGCAQRILHFDIKPHNILLDQNFHPKISDFGLAKLCSKDQSIVSMTMARGTIGYIAPEVFSRNFGKVSPKSDVYSFGMLLLEMVGGRNADNNAQNGSETYFPEWIYHRLEQGEVTIQVDDGDDSNIARKLTIVGLWCIGWHPVDRPSMRHVIQMLERQGCPAMPPNPFKSTHSANAFMDELETISESEW